MTAIVWFDPSEENVNSGDEIIAEAISRHLPEVADGVPRLTTHRLLRSHELELVRAADVVFVGGTNLLNSRLLIDRQWPMPPWQIAAIRRKLVFVGVGWWQYQRPPRWPTAAVFRLMSHPDVPHAVRDQYTADRLGAIGVPAIMTGCPTMWALDGTSSRITRKVPVAAITLTDYYFRLEEDRAWISLLKQYFQELLVVGMGPGDRAAFDKLPPIEGVRWFSHGTEGLRLARACTTVHIGTRLHAGVRWLQLGGSTIILAVDNRAREMSSSTGLPVVGREDLVALDSRLRDIRTDDIHMPVDAIARWRAAWEAAVAPGGRGE